MDLHLYDTVHSITRHDIYSKMIKNFFLTYWGNYCHFSQVAKKIIHMKKLFWGKMTCKTNVK
jgi:hypothetical protein